MSAPTAPMVLRLPAHEQAISQAVRDAMRAALAGDFARLDELEVAFLNVLVRIGELKIRESDGALHEWCTPGGAVETYGVTAPFVTAYLRGHRRDGGAALEWQLREKCRRCVGLLHRRECRVCEGRWYVDDFDDHEILYTDLDGVLL